MNRNAVLASKLAKIAGILYLFFGLSFLIVSWFSPVEVTLNDYESRGTIYELASEPGPFIFLLILISIPIIFGIIGLIISSKVKQRPSKLQAIMMIVIGVMSAFFLVGILFIVAGIQTLLAKKELEMTNTTIKNADE